MRDYSYLTKRIFEVVMVFGIALVLGCSDDKASGESNYEGDEPGECSDGADNDRDDYFDCKDPGCAGSAVCSGNADSYTTDSEEDTDDDDGQDTGNNDTGEPQDTGNNDTGQPQDTGDDGTGAPQDTGNNDTGEPQDTGNDGTGAPQDTGVADTGEPQDTDADDTATTNNTPTDTGENTGQDTGSASTEDTASVGTSSAAQIAVQLGREANFLFGLGNVGTNGTWAESGVHGLPETLDFHYEYIVSIPGEGGWTEWSPNGMYPIEIAEADIAAGVTPMVTVYMMAAWGDGNTTVVSDNSYMSAYWEAAKILMERYGNEINGHPAMVHLEPDFWVYLQFDTGGNASSMSAVLHPECSHLPNDLTGLGRCWIHLTRTYAPNVVIGFHASNWGTDATEVGQFLLDCGADESDVVFTDVLDRDVGCFEAAELSQCQRDGEYYWDDADYREHLAWISELHSVMNKPVVWWQLPLGVPSDTPGGTPGHYRDNRVEYIFSHVQDFIDVGGLAACFGTGDEGQTDITTDGGQFADAITNYYANPIPLP